MHAWFLLQKTWSHCSAGRNKLPCTSQHTYFGMLDSWWSLCWEGELQISHKHFFKFNVSTHINFRSRHFFQIFNDIILNYKMNIVKSVLQNYCNEFYKAMKGKWSIKSTDMRSCSPGSQLHKEWQDVLNIAWTLYCHQGNELGSSLSILLMKGPDSQCHYTTLSCSLEFKAYTWEACLRSSRILKNF